MAPKRRSFEVFSLSFLDCICCGFGAVLLLFVLTIGRASADQRTVVATMQATINRTTSDLTQEKDRASQLTIALQQRDERLTRQRAVEADKKKDVTELQEKLALLLQLAAETESEKKRLLAEKAAIPTVDEPPPVPIPNTQRRQYLSGFNFSGDYLIFMVKFSGGMLGNNVEEAIAMQSLTDDEKRQAVKWRRVVKSVQWILANLGPDQRYQVLLFNNEATPLIPTRVDEWFDPMDRNTTKEILQRLDAIVPKGGANLERAFLTVRDLFPSVDNIALLTDALPTLSDSFPTSAMTTDRDRIRNFRAALRAVPPRTPINVILYPMSGDPAGPFLFWQLADKTDGSLISPAPSWPDI